MALDTLQFSSSEEVILRVRDQFSQLTALTIFLKFDIIKDINKPVVVTKPNFW